MSQQPPKNLISEETVEALLKIATCIQKAAEEYKKDPQDYDAIQKFHSSCIDGVNAFGLALAIKLATYSRRDRAKEIKRYLGMLKKRISGKE